MRSFSFFLLLTSVSFAADKSAVMQTETFAPMPTNTQITMNIDSKARLQDLVQALNMMKKEKGAAKVFLLLKNGDKINQISDFSPLPNQTLVIVRFATNIGSVVRVVSLEDIDSILVIP